MTRPIETPTVFTLFGDRPEIRREPGKTLSPRRTHCATIDGMRKRVLIVDDHQPFRAAARELLEEAGYVVAGEAGTRRRRARPSPQTRPMPYCSTSSSRTKTASPSRRR